ncbi:NUDIX hydrolase [Paucisalibacillus sp. EB02]|uniref:NUDIX hydrolase n=1 Tax=Paucisalibacillus sp. EB02 TaxID=1347087 RepID=UPI0005A61CAD|nr:NUDIX hydrolase [Paucisalibacillus sp. EB02]
MGEWHGAAGVCLNEDYEVLMVRAKGSNAWSTPSGGIEVGETPQACCIRELKEETGYSVRIKKDLFVKETEIKGIAVIIHYFLVENIGQSSGINDPDRLIGEAAWKSLADIENLEHAYPEDQKTIENLIKYQLLEED